MKIKLFFLVCLLGISGCSLQQTNDKRIKSNYTVKKQQSVTAQNGGIKSRPENKAPDDIVLSGNSFCKEEFLDLNCYYDKSQSKNISSIELWKTSDSGRSWQMAMQIRPIYKQFKIKLPEGKWGFYAVAVMKDRGKAKRPKPGDSPSLSVVIDRTPPRIEFGTIKVTRAETPMLPEVDSFKVKVPFEIFDKNLAKNSSLGQVASANKLSWRTISRFSDPKGVMSLKITSFHSPLTIRLSSKDMAGNIAFKETTIWPKDMVEHPVVKITSPQNKSFLRGGEKITVLYQIKWNNAVKNPVNLSYTLDRKTWISLVDNGPNTGKYQWIIPRGDYPKASLRLEARGITGRLIVHTVEPLHLDSTPPDAIILGPGTIKELNGAVLVSCKDSGISPSGVAKISIFAKKRLKDKLIKIAETDNPSKYIRVKLPAAGLYKLWIVAWDKVGNHSPEPPSGRPFPIQVKSSSEELMLETFTKESILRGGSSHYLAWRLGNLLSPPVSGRIILIDGDNITELRKINPLAEKGLFTIPKKEMRNAFLRLEISTADKDTISAQTRPFCVAARSPQAKILSGSVKGDKITLNYHIKKQDIADIKTAFLYSSLDGGKTWNKQQELDMSGFVTIKGNEGFNSFIIVAEDEVGNHNPIPENDCYPDITLVKNKIPATDFVLENFKGGETVRGGSTHYVFWHCKYSNHIMPEKPVVLQLSTDGGKHFHTISKDLPASGKYALTIPESNNLKLRVKILLQTTVGYVLSRMSHDNILVDSSPPLIMIMGPTTSNKRETLIKVHSAEDLLSGLQEIFVYGRRRPLDTWKRLKHKIKKEGIEIKLSDGRWDIFVGGKDKVGNESPLPEEKDKGYSILVDTAPPLLSGTRTPNAPSLNAGTTVTYELSIKDINPDPLSISIKTKTNGFDQSWKERENYWSVNNPYHLILPEKEGVMQILFTAKDLAGNKNTWFDMVNIVIPPPEISFNILKKSFSKGGDPQKFKWEKAGKRSSFKGGDTIKVAWKATNAGKNATIVFSVSGCKDNKTSWKKIGEGSRIKGDKEFKLPEDLNSRKVFVKATLQNNQFWSAKIQNNQSRSTNNTPGKKQTCTIIGPITVSAKPPEGIIYGNVLKQ